MSGVLGVDQLRGDAQPAATLSDRAFEQVTHAQFATDPLYVDRLAFVSKARIARDYEEPANPA
jgi:flagellum-specific peptidoglycan hydrolase FlgJ